MRDVEYRPGKQLLLAVAQELAHRGVGAEEAGSFGLDLGLADAAGIEHDAEHRLALTDRSFGTFQVCDVGDCRNHPDYFVVLPLRLVVAMHELWLARLARQIHFKLELDRLASEALEEIGLEGRPGIFA